MKDKVDKQIKRFLKSKAEKVTESKLMNSSYYIILIDEDQFKIRFSNHRSGEKTDVDLDIISISSGYIIYFDGCSLFASEDDVLKVIKSLLLILPEVIKSINNLRDIVKKQQNEYNKVNQKYLTLLKKSSIKTDHDKLVEMYEQDRKNAIEKFEKINEENLVLKQKINSLKKKLTKTLHLIDTFKSHLKTYL